MQGPIRRLANELEQTVLEHVAYLERVNESERSGQWNDEVRGTGPAKAFRYNSPAGARGAGHTKMLGKEMWTFDLCLFL
jgi:hypothetical protein